MRKSKINRLALFSFLLLGGMAGLMQGGCSTEECYDNRNALTYAGFYGIGAPGDSILSEGNRSIANLYLPFRIDSDTTQYVFKLINKLYEPYNIADTLTFIYSREARFVSAACGASYVYTIKDIKTTGLLIDSVAVPGGRITNADVENIHIYFNTGEDPDYSEDDE